MRLVRAKRSPITDLFEDMKDGTVLMSLIEVLTGQNLVRSFHVLEQLFAKMFVQVIYYLV